MSQPLQVARPVKKPPVEARAESTRAPLVSVVVPVKDEEASVVACVEQLTRVLVAEAGQEWEILFVDDGSRDGTWMALQLLHARDRRVRCLSLSRNFGKEAALSAGLDHARGDAVIPFDADLQDPPEVIGLMLARWREGYEVVDGVRADRASDSRAKRWSAGLYYRLHNRLSADKIPTHVGDFRLLDRKVVEAIKRMPERNRFMKGLFAWSGFRTAQVEYRRAERVEGATKFNAWRLWTLALDGLTSSTTLPLRIWSYIGGVIALAALGFAAVVVVRTLLWGSPVSGYPSLMVSVMFFGGVQLLSLGILGEYVGRILVEAKGRPIYIVRDELGD